MPPAFLSLLLALENADPLSRGETVFYPDRRSARQCTRGNQRCALDSALGRESDFGHSGIAARLGDLAPAQLGRAAAGFLFGGGRSDSRSQMDPQTSGPGGATRLERLVRTR